MDWGQHRVFVTGATGIVGSWLVKRLLSEGAYIVALIRDWDPQSELIRSGDVNRTSVVSGRLEDFQTLERAISEHETDTVFHLGAQTIVGTALRSPLATFEANIRGTYNLLEACRTHSGIVKRVVVASSDKAYGDVDVLPYTEDMIPNGRHPYDVSKSCADLLATTYAHTYRLPLSVARCGNIYGGGDLNWSRIVPGTIRSMWHKQRPVLRSDGKFIRDYIYVQDVVNAYLKLAERTDAQGVRGEAFNFSNESKVSVLDMTFKIQQLMGCTDLEPIILNQAEAEIKDQYLDSSKARRLLDWRPHFNLERGLKETIDWYQNFFATAAGGKSNGWHDHQPGE
jgi:CDP-glucose 4,6-dehydratase